MKVCEARVCEAELSRDKIQAEFSKYKEQTQNVGLLMSQCEENASLRAEFELAKKMIMSVEAQLRAETARHGKEVEKAWDERRLEMDAVQALRAEIGLKEKTIQVRRRRKRRRKYSK